ncbi:MAG: RNA polymerase sigma factor, partial [Rhizobiaceae bacterium]|nr:RNA polymerase sigma factor [Rhizobiaceae bacterium]
AHVDTFSPGTSLKSWLFTIMRNTYFTNYRRRGRSPLMSEIDAGEIDIPMQASQTWVIYAQNVQSALGRLRPHYRHALLLVSSGVSYEEAAILCHCEVGTIKSRVARARSQLLMGLGECSCADAATLQ